MQKINFTKMKKMTTFGAPHAHIVMLLPCFIYILGMEGHGNMLIDLKEKVMAEMGVKRDNLIFIMINPIFVFLTG